jgi:hypothetical protein
VAVSVAVSASGEEYAFWEGANAALWMATNTGGTWTGPTSPGMGPLGSEPTVAIDGSNVFVFWKGQNAALWMAVWNGSTWTGPTSPGMGPLGSPPAATYDAATGDVDVFWKGSDSNLWGASYAASSTTWTGPVNDGFGPLGSQPTAGSDAAGNIYVYWQGSGNNTHVWEGWYSHTSTTWSGPVDLGTWTGNTGSQPTTAVTNAGNQYLYWQGLDGNLYEAYWNGTTWVGWNSLGNGPLNSAPAAGVTPAASPTTLYVQWQGTDLNLWGATLTFSNSSWTGPTDAGMGPLT